MKSWSQKTKTHIRNASLFLLGVIVTIIITKISDIIIPTEPILVKQYTDTIKIVHDYKIPDNLNNDTTRRELERKIKNLELLNNYDQQIKEKLANIDSKTDVLPNLILTHNVDNLTKKGYTQGSSTAYFSSDGPALNSKYLDIYINFLNPSISNEIAYLRVNIYRFYNNNTTAARSFVLEEFYEVKPTNNMIRINNDLEKGNYEILYGFVFKNDLNKKFPTFYSKKHIGVKE